jgi:hypothetical protein
MLELFKNMILQKNLIIEFGFARRGKAVQRREHHRIQAHMAFAHSIL